jgi:hypothetical protein
MKSGDLVALIYLNLLLLTRSYRANRRSDWLLEVKAQPGSSKSR